MKKNIYQMKTEIFKTKRGNKALFKKVKDTIKNKWLVAFPTETVYWLGANALDDDACKKIYLAKGRPSDNPLIIHIAKSEDLETYGEISFPYIYNLIKAFWPGPLTFVIKKKSIIGKTVSGWLDTVAVRFPSHPLAQKIIATCWVPIAAPSANSSWKPSPTSADSVIQDLDGKVDIIIDGGNTQVGLESTVLDVTGEIPVILRHGGVTKEMLEKVVWEIQEISSKNQEKRSPWTRYKHYAPETPVEISSPKERKEILKQIFSWEKVCFIGLNISKENNKQIFSFSSKKAFAKNLFETLRKCDTLNSKKIFIEQVDESWIGKALMNRIKKSAGVI